MLRITTNVKIWFELYSLTPDQRMVKLSGVYPLEYGDSRFNRAYEKIRKGAIPIDVNTRKKVVLDRQSAEEMYSDDYPYIPTGISVDSNFLDKLAIDGRKKVKYKKKDLTEMPVKNTDRLIQKAKRLQSKGEKVPSYLKKYLDRKNVFKQSKFQRDL